MSPICIEEWKNIEGYDGAYQVSDIGRVRSFRASNYSRGEAYTLKQYEPNHYKNVILYKDKKSKNHLVHKLVAAAFIGKRPDGYHIDHIDGNKTNNDRDNLCYVTHRENMNRSARKRKCGKMVGVQWVKPVGTKKGRWMANIGVNGKKVCLYSGKDFDDACAAREIAESIINGHISEVESALNLIRGKTMKGAAYVSIPRK